MKTFIASLITFFIIISLVSTNIFFLHAATNEFHADIDRIITYIESSDWNNTKKSYQSLSDRWNNRIIWLEAFINHRKTEQISELLHEIKNQIEFKNKNQVILRVNKLKLLFMFIYDDEIPTIENII